MTAIAATAPSGFPGLIWLTKRELMRVVRQPTRVAASIGTPLILWVFFGSGFAGASRGDEMAYGAYLLPGMASLTVMFSSIFAAMSLIDDRHAGFLQSVLVSPLPRWALVGSKILGGSLLATAQGAVLLLAGPLVGIEAGVGGYLLAILALGAISVGICGFGLGMAWLVDSTHGFHGIMNLVLMPMWGLSGAFFAVDEASKWLSWLILVDPLTWPTMAMRNSLSGAAWSSADMWPWVGTFGFAAGGFVLAWSMVGRASKPS